MGEIADALRRADRTEPVRGSSPRELPIAGNTPSSERPDTTKAEDKSNQPSAPPEQKRDLAPRILKRDGDDEWSPARTAISDPHGSATQQFRRLAFRTQELADARKARSIVVTSAQLGDGKTTTICNLAVQLARLDQARRVILVDLDLRRPSIAPTFGLELDISVDAVLRGDHPVGDAIFETDVDGLSMVAMQHAAEDPESLLAHPNLRSMIRELESRFDLVLIDTPPVLAVTDVQLILRHASAAIFVARAGSTTVKAIRRALDLLPPKKFLGSFLNSSPNSQGMNSYPYYGYGESPANRTEPSDAQ